MVRIYVDADSCPVKDEVYLVAARGGLSVTVVANQSLHVPDFVDFELVPDRFDAADDWIAERAGPGDVVVTGDILLAARCLEAGARAIGTRGKPFDEATIGDAKAAREAEQFFREMGLEGRGPAPFEPRDRSRFTQGLETLVQAIRRAGR